MTPRDLERPHPAYNPFALGAGLLFWFAIFAAIFTLVQAVRQ